MTASREETGKIRDQQREGKESFFPLKTYVCVYIYNLQVHDFKKITGALVNVFGHKQ